MTLTSGWVEVTQSPFTHEAEGLRIIRELLPDEPPFHAWSNFEFRDGQGKWHEVDLIVLGRRRMHLVELKYYSGTLRGDDHVWRRDGHRAEDSPLKLARRKAQRLASRLAEELRRLARETGVQIPDERDVLPFVQESVFLHHQGLRCQLPTASRQDLFGPDGLEDQTLLPGVSTRLLEPAESSSRRSIDTRRAKIIAKLMAGIGAVQRRQRQAGSWVIDDEPLGEGDDWQDWPAFHQVTQDRKARIRFAITPPGTSDSELTLMRKLAEHEYRTVSALTHEGVLTPIDLVDMELGIGLVYPREEGFQRLDLWMADHREGIPLLTQLSLLRQIGETLAYAHRHRVVHRGLSPSAVLVRPAPNKTMQAVVSNWQLAGRSSTTTSSSASPVTMLGNASQTAVERLAAGTSDTGLSPHAFQAPEGVWARDADRVKLDIFALGALAYYLIAKRPPATTTSSLRERLGRDNGLDLSADVPQVPSVLRELILGATRPQVSERLADVPKFLEGLAKSEEIVSAPDRDDNADPMDALPGALLAGRFRLERRLGSGSTAVGLLVTDLAPESDKTDSRRVLKIAVDDAAADRLAAEAEVLRGLHSPRIVRLIEGPLAVGSRTALLLQFAGDETLADVLSARHTRLSLDLLERYGNDLLDAVVALDAAGVDHRDIKPANLGVSEARGGDRAKHLVLFDFSLTRAAASAVNAGTPGYLDPFLGTGKRTRFDSAAERYAATVVLFEMATGALPVYGDGASDPVSSGAQLRVDSSLFDSAVAASLNKFFTNALGPDVGRRPHTVQEMHAEWRAAFAPVPHTQPDDADELAASAVPTTPLARSGLSARALSAIEPLRVRTVGEFVALDPVRLNRLPGAADATRREVKSRAK
ncbi:MAG: protein kinase domain-containing protein, partial [Nakamurella sp.]